MRSLGPPDKLKSIYQVSGGAMSMDYIYRGGADIGVCKDICRQNVQVVVANGRGAGRAFAKPYAFDMDLWHSQYWMSYAPSEIKDILLSYFFGGADYQFYEMMPMTPYQKPNALGATVLKTCRFMQDHPKLGKSVVPIGVLRGPCETWRSLYARTTGWGWSISPSEAEKQKNRDYDLLSIFFDKFGISGVPTCEGSAQAPPMGRSILCHGIRRSII